MKFGDFTLDVLMEKIPPRPDESTAQYLCRAEAQYNEHPEILMGVVESIKAEMTPKLEFREGDTLIATGAGWYHSYQGKRCVINEVTDKTVTLTWDGSTRSQRYERRFVEGYRSDQRFIKA